MLSKKIVSSSLLNVTNGTWWRTFLKKIALVNSYDRIHITYVLEIVRIFEDCEYYFERYNYKVFFLPTITIHPSCGYNEFEFLFTPSGQETHFSHFWIDFCGKRLELPLLYFSFLLKLKKKKISLDTKHSNSYNFANLDDKFQHFWRD